MSNPTAKLQSVLWRDPTITKAALPEPPPSIFHTSARHRPANCRGAASSLFMEGDIIELSVGNVHGSDQAKKGNKGD